VSTRVREAVAIVVVLALVLVLEAFSLKSGTIGLVLIGVVAVLAVAVIVFRVSFRLAGVGAACLASLTLTWHGVFLGPIRPGDALIFVALLCFIVADPNHAFGTPPWWVKQLIFVLLFLAMIQIFFPPDPVYLAQRITFDAGGKATRPATGNLALTNIGVAIKFIVAVAATPMAFIGAVRVDKRALRWIVIAFVVGSASSGWVAMVDHLGGNFGRILTGLPNASARQVGFADHPNFLAVACVIAVPFAFWMAYSEQRRDRVIGIIALPGLVLGTYASGSRGGAVCVLIVLALCVVLHPKSRPHAPSFAGAGLVFVGLIAAAVPSIGAAILRATRLTSSPITVGSDQVRALAGAQGARDFRHSPFAGIGLQASGQASQVYLQELATGGLILFIGVSVYTLGGIVASIRLMRTSALAGMVLAALLTSVVLNYVETDLTDRFYYVPAAILITLLDMQRRQADSESEPISASVPA
jgi:hypothetical protein